MPRVPTPSRLGPILAPLIGDLMAIGAVFLKDLWPCSASALKETIAALVDRGLQFLVGRGHSLGQLCKRALTLVIFAIRQAQLDGAILQQAGPTPCRRRSSAQPFAALRAAGHGRGNACLQTGRGILERLNQDGVGVGMIRAGEKRWRSAREGRSLLFLQEQVLSGSTASSAVDVRQGRDARFTLSLPVSWRRSQAARICGCVLASFNRPADSMPAATRSRRMPASASTMSSAAVPSRRSVEPPVLLRPCEGNLRTLPAGQFSGALQNLFEAAAGVCHFRTP